MRISWTPGQWQSVEEIVANESPSQQIVVGLQEDIVNALALTGQVLMGQAVMVKSSEV